MANAAKIKREYTFAVGRRKEAVARVRIYQKDAHTWGNLEIKKGEMAVNELPVSQYFSGEISQVLYQTPLKITNTLGKFVVTVKVAGGGKNSQLEALVHGVARALDNIDQDKYHDVLKKNKLLTRDPRVRQRRTVGTGGKARRQKQSPKR